MENVELCAIHFIPRSTYTYIMLIQVLLVNILLRLAHSILYYNVKEKKTTKDKNYLINQIQVYGILKKEV